MRVLEIAPPWFAVPPVGYGGIERVVSLLADGLVDAGHDVTLVASGGSKTRATLATVFEQPPSDHLGEAAYDLQQCVAAFDDVQGFDIIHDHSGLIGASMGAMVKGVQVVHTVHGSWEPHVVPVYRAISDRVALVAISQSQRELAPTGVRIAGVVHNGIDVDSFPYRGGQGTGSGPLAWVGRATPDKGADIAIKVARELGRPLRMAIKLNERREHDYFTDVLEPLLEGVDVDLVRNANRAQAAELMAACDVTLMPIRWPEPFGLVMVESMAVGTPVVALANGAAPEIVGDGHSGALVPRDADLAAFCSAVERADTLPRSACREWVTDRFSAQAMVSGYERTFRRLLSERTTVDLRVAAAVS